MNRNSGWAVTFWAVVIICVLQYFFRTLPLITKSGNLGVAVLMGSLLPNSVIIYIFLKLKKNAEKKEVKGQNEIISADERNL